MAKLKPGSCREVTWDEVRLGVQALAPDLFAAIEAMSPDPTYKLYEVTYPYGAEVVDHNGYFNLPYQDKFLPLGSKELGDELNSQLGINYPGLSLGIVLNGELQLSFEEKGQLVVPAEIFKQGHLFALNGSLDHPVRYQLLPYWRMHAGVRPAYLLTPLGNREKFARLEKYLGNGLEYHAHQKEQWKILRDIANSPNFKTHWHSRLLFFGRKWIENLNQHPEFKLVIFEHGWYFTRMERSSFTSDEIWREFIANLRNKKVDRYVLSIAKHIFDVAIGSNIGFKVADNTDAAGPFSTIANILVEIMQLRNYSPIFMVPTRSDPKVHEPRYVSIQLPTLRLVREYVSKSQFLMADVREIYYVIDRFLKSTSAKRLKETPPYDVTQYGYDFYTTAPDRMGIFQSSKTLFDSDPHLAYWQALGNTEIYDRNTFMRACVRISRNDKEQTK